VRNITVEITQRVHGRVIETTGPTGRQEPEMTNSFTKLRHAGLMLAVAFTVSASPSHAFTITAEGKALCTGDAYRLCSAEIPSIPKITSCMLAKKAQLSAPCRAYIDRQIAARSGKVATND
jgi:hypothetical protein